MNKTFEQFLMESKPFAEKIQKIGGKAYFVGGCVRDWKMGIAQPKDYDFVVSGVTTEKFQNAFPDAMFVGDEENGFPVFLLDVAGEKCEVAFARKEKKVGAGYKGFETYTDSTLTIYDDLIRRDLTMNAMAIDIMSEMFIDPHGGLNDLKNGIIKHVSPAFQEDPLRVLRAARFAARFGFQIHPETLEYMKSLKEELYTLKPERIFVETKKALSCKKPSLYFKVLKESDVLDVFYKEIAALVGVEQRKDFHPEGDAFEHTMNVVDAMAELSERVEVRFAALVHDVGKADSPIRWRESPETNPVGTHYGHEALGVPYVKELCKRLKLPKKWLRAGVFGAEHHGTLHKLGQMSKTKSLRKIVSLMEQAHKNPIGVEGMALLALADTRGKGDFAIEHPYVDLWLNASKEVLKIKANTKLPLEELLEDKVLRQIDAFRKVKEKQKSKLDIKND